MAEEEVAAWFESFVKALNQGAAAFFREIDQDVHAKNGVHAADVNGGGQIHLRV